MAPALLLLLLLLLPPFASCNSEGNPFPHHKLGFLLLLPPPHHHQSSLYSDLILCAFFVFVFPGDALHALRRSLSDPDNVLQSWDPTLVNPCTWFHVTCDRDNHVTRV